MASETPFERLGQQLEAAAARQVDHAKTRPVVPGRRLWGGRTLAVAILAVVVGAGVAWAATSLLSSGPPVPFERGAPIAGRAQGAPIPGTVKLLTGDVADPAGGAPWGLRYWETDRKYGCVQVGRVYDGKLGQITAGKVFHELQLGFTEGAVLGGCFILDGSGHAFTAVHLDAQAGAQPLPCLAGVKVGTEIPQPHGRVIRCIAPDVTVDFGLLGPHAKSLTYRIAATQDTAMALGDVGGYLIVQRHIKPVLRPVGFHHADPTRNFFALAEPYLALTPASQTIKRVVYTDGTCHVHVTALPMGACATLAGFVAIPQPKVADLRSPVHANAAPTDQRISVRFRAREAVIDGRSAYDIEVRPDNGKGFSTQDYARNVAAATTVHTTVPLYNHLRGGYRIVVRYRTVGPHPGPSASLIYPGLLVGQTHIEVP